MAAPKDDQNSDADADYAWQTKAWPNLVYDAKAVQGDFERVTAKAGELAGLRASLRGMDGANTYVNEVVDEAVSSFAIEGEQIDKGRMTQSVMLSLLNRDAKDAAKGYRNVAEVMLEARDPSVPLTAARLNDWHRKMFEGDRFMKDIGQLRSDEMQVVTMKNMEVRAVHFEAPPPERLPKEMKSFVAWLDKTGPTGKDTDRLPTPARAAIAHLRFETIHPYSDGNGRIGRAIADHVTSQSPTYVRAPFSLSRVIQTEKKDYYDALQSGQGAKPNENGEIDVTKFVKWFSNAMERGIERARDEARFIVARNRFFDDHGDALNERQDKVLRRVFEEGPERLAQGLSAKPYQRMAGTSSASATRDLADLAAKGILIPKEAGGRSTGFTVNVKTEAAQPADETRVADAQCARDVEDAAKERKPKRGRKM